MIFAHGARNKKGEALGVGGGGEGRVAINQSWVTGLWVASAGHIARGYRERPCGKPAGALRCLCAVWLSLKSASRMSIHHNYACMARTYNEAVVVKAGTSFW